MPLLSLRSLLRRCTLLACLAVAWLGAGAAQAEEDSVMTIAAQAWMSYINGFNGQPQKGDSNRVHAMAPVTGAKIGFYSDNRYGTQVWTTRGGQLMHPRIVASACNADPLRADTLTVHLRAARSGQQVDVTAVETAPNSGVFQLGQGVAHRFWTVAAPAAAGLLDVMPGDVIVATASSCNGKTLTADLRMDPRAVVFDASNGRPIAGAWVQLIDVSGEGNGGNAGGPAVVFAADGTTPMPAKVMTDDGGAYEFPFLKASLYRLVVTPPAAGYVYPSAREADRTAGRSGAFQVDASASYGGTFRITTLTDNAVVNLPLDPRPRGLAVQSSASRSSVEIGETLEYAVSVKNVGEVELSHVRLQDVLPVGVGYVPGTARVDGTAVADPVDARGPRLSWPITAKLPAQGEHTLRYRARIGTGALQGDGVHRSQGQAEAPEPVLSNVATHKIKVEAGVFSDRAIVLGTVFVDCNANGVKDDGEQGVPGVRLWLEDGTSVTTDSAGRYSLYGLSPRTHVLKLDAITLPAGAEPLATSQRHAGDGASRFVDPRAGELQRADFSLGGCSDALLAQVQQRVQAARAVTAEITGALRTSLTTTPAAPADLRALPASGRIGERAVVDAPMPTAATPATLALPLESDADTSLPRFERVKDGQLMTATDARLRVVGRLGAQLTLLVNGEPVGDDRVGEKAQSSDDQTEARLYVGLPLSAGDNRLTLQERDPFGQLRATRELTVRLAGALARIVVDAPAQVDAGASVPVRLRLEDAHGLPVDARLPLTLNLAPGRWATPDLDPKTPELQTFVEGGEVTLQWQAPDVPGEARLTVASDGIAADARVAVVAALRPLMAVGVIDAAFNLRRLKGGQLQPANAADGFESELRAFSDRTGGSTEGRAAVFLKGKVRGDALLTVAYDSDKASRERLFRDIQPDAFYPVYGDASERGFDAQSTGKLYVRIDRGQSSLLYGDFTTQATDDKERQLGVYQRSLNGVKEHFQVKGLSANVWAAHDTTRQQIVELRANGTSGPFALAANMAVNSEKVEVIVRDGNQPALVISTTAKTRFADYEIEALTGRLLMRAPVPSVDADLNPVSIRVTYEVDQGGPAFWVAGADAQWQVTEALQVGGAVVRDWNPLATMQMGSVNARYQLAEKTVLSAEAAHLERGDTVEGVAAHEGDARRVALTHDGKDFKARVHAARSDVGFDNRSAQINGGRSEAGAQASYQVDERTRLMGEALFSGDLASDMHRVGVLVGVERSFEGGTKVELGARHVQQHGGAPGAETADTTTTTVRAKASMAVPGLPTATVFVEAEQDVRDSAKRLVAIGGDYQLAGKGRLYARHELVSSLSGPYALDATQRRNTTVVGLDMASGLGGSEGRVFSEYRGREAFSGRETEAAVGLRNQWELRKGLRVNASLERVQALAGAKGKNGENQSAAVTGAVEYTADPRWKGTARLELRESTGSTAVLSTLGLAVKLDDRWTLLAKNVLAGTIAHGAAADRWQERFQLGAAYRDDANQLNALGRYEYKDERGGLADAAARRAHIVSVHAEKQVDKGLEVTGRYAAKLVTEAVAGLRTRSAAQLASLRVTQDLGERWDVGVNASVMGDLTSKARLRSRQTAFGGEVGYRVKDNMWASAGYNVRGFKDRDLSGDNATERGVYVRLRFKFDERLFGRG